MFDQISHFIDLGGSTVVVLAIFSIAALTVVFYKSWQYWAYLKLGSSLGQQALERISGLHYGEALILTKGSVNPRAALINRMLSMQSENKLSQEQMGIEARRYARNKIADMASYLRVLEVVAALSPLLGLFGTVLGMIEAFQAMQAAGANVSPSLLAAGIWKALLTTAVGLVIAMPASIALSWLERRVEVEALALQNIIDKLSSLFSITEIDSQTQVKFTKSESSAKVL